MDNALGVSSIYSIGNLNPQIKQFIRLHGAALDAVLEGLAFQVLHDNKRLTFVIADVVNDADVGMVQ